ncbi:DUF4760 domain-containing protein [Candidatus Thiosymbion oneisti]|uniref:DUF4760 domain-containing protein n=1 Tax=Candidatus Thiosymbion oneisti TaxID=589554 RepID=UPI000B7DB343|nr:DUF4760 domain-containing protein [Candidatus Thiosymbion oneisti]
MMTNYEIANLSIMAASALFVSISLIYLSRQLKLFVAAHADNHKWNRCIETQRALGKTREINMDALNDRFGFVNRKDPIPPNEILDAFNDDYSLQLILHKLLNFYEGLAIGVFMGIYDVEVIKAHRRGAMERTFVNFKNYIEHRRNQISKTLWTAYERLIKKWEDESLKGFDR